MKHFLTILIIFFLLGCSTQQKYISGAFGYKFGQTLTESMIVLQDEKNFFKIYGAGKTWDWLFLSK